MTLISSLRSALRPFVRRLRALVGAAPMPPKLKGAAPKTPAKAKPSARPKAPTRPRAGAKPKPPARKPARKPAPPPVKPVADRSQEARLKHFPPRDEPWSLLLLGGSNTVIKNGYVDGLLATLEDRLGPPRRVTNLAVGGNSSVHGLMIAKEAREIAAHDIAVIEYGVNDVKLSRAERMDVWRGAIEGLLRHLLTARPDLHVVFALFSRRDMTQAAMFAPADAVLELVAHYGRSHRVSVIDIDHLYRDVLFRDRAAFAALYEDGPHYGRPQVARLTGALVASEILAMPKRPAADLPPPLHPWHFGGAEVVDLAAHGKADRVFSNSRYVCPARRLAVGERLTLDLPGPLAAFEYISARDSATLRVSEEGEQPRAYHTRNLRVGEPNFPAFLVRCEEMPAKPWASGAGGPRRVTFEALATADEGELVGSAYRIPDRPGAAAEAVYLTRLLCAP